MKRVKLKQAAAHMQRIENKLRTELQRAETATAQEVLTTARRLSSGPFSQRQLAQLGHPYATQHRNKRQFTGQFLAELAYMINVDKGNFLRSWRVRQSVWSGGRLRGAVVNQSRHARFLAQGTRRMIPRPLVAEVIKLCKANRFRRIREAVRRSFRSA